MKDLFKFFKELLKKQPRGAVAIEYVLIAATIVLGSFSYLKNVENGVRNRLVGIAGSLVGFDNTVNGGDINGDGEGGNESANNATPPPADVCTEDCAAQGKICREGKCVGCNFDADCGGKKCDTSKGLCVDCRSNTDCKAGEICKNGSCITDPNSCNPPCAQGQICDKGSGTPTCVVDEKCAGEDNTCKSTQTCFEGFCKDMPAECGKCDPEKERCENGRCVLRGKGACQSVNCGNGEYCLDGVCKKGSACTSSNDCSGGQVCGGGICAPATCDPQLCKNTFVGSVCINDNCVIGNDTNCAPGVWDSIAQECTTTCSSAESMKEGPCGPGKFCLNGKCVSTDQCKDNNTWDPNTKTCKPSSCAGDWGDKSTCPDGFFCANNSCEDVTSKCTGIGGTWANNKCTVTCSNTDLGKGTCPDGTFCLAGKCVDVDSQCTGKGGTWENGKCNLTCTVTDLSKGTCPDGTFCLGGVCVDQSKCSGDFGTWEDKKKVCTQKCTDTWGTQGVCADGFFCADGKCVKNDMCGSLGGGGWEDGTFPGDEGACLKGCQTDNPFESGGCPDGMFCFRPGCRDNSKCAELVTSTGHGVWDDYTNSCKVPCSGTMGERGDCPRGEGYCLNGYCGGTRACEELGGEVIWDNGTAKCVKETCTGTWGEPGDCFDGFFCDGKKCIDFHKCSDLGGEWADSDFSDGLVSVCHKKCTGIWGEQGECPEGQFCRGTVCYAGTRCEDVGGEWDERTKSCLMICSATWGSNMGCPDDFFCDTKVCRYKNQCSSDGGTWDGTRCNLSCTYHDLSQGECKEGQFCWKGECKDQSFCNESFTGRWNTYWDTHENACTVPCGEVWGEPVTSDNSGGFMCIDGHLVHQDGCESLGGTLVENPGNGLYCRMYCTGTNWGEKGDCPKNHFCNGELCYPVDECRRQGGKWDGYRCNVSCTYHDLSQGECKGGQFCYKGECKDQSFCGTRVGGEDAYWDDTKNACVAPCRGAWGKPMWDSPGFMCVDGQLVDLDACESLGGAIRGPIDGGYCHMYCTGTPWGEKGNCPDNQFCDGDLCKTSDLCGSWIGAGASWDGEKCSVSCTYHDLSQGECKESQFCYKGECKDQSFCNKSLAGRWDTSWDPDENACIAPCGESWGEPATSDNSDGFMCIDGHMVHQDGCESLGGALVEYPRGNGLYCRMYCTGTNWGEKGYCPDNHFCNGGLCYPADECRRQGGKWDGEKCTVYCDETGIVTNGGWVKWEGAQGSCPDTTFCWEGECVDKSLCSGDGIGGGMGTSSLRPHWDDTKNACVPGACAGASWGMKCGPNFFCHEGSCVPNSVCSVYFGRWDEEKDTCVEYCTEPWGTEGGTNTSDCHHGFFCANGECVKMSVCNQLGGKWEWRGSNSICVVPCTNTDLSQGKCPDGTFCLDGACTDTYVCEDIGGKWDGKKCQNGCIGDWGTRAGCETGFFCADGKCVQDSLCTELGGKWDGEKCNLSCTYHDLSQGECKKGQFCYKGECKNAVEFCNSSMIGGRGTSWDPDENACITTCPEGWGAPATSDNSAGFMCIDGHLVHPDGCESLGGTLVEKPGRGLYCRMYCTGTNWGEKGNCPDNQFCDDELCYHAAECGLKGGKWDGEKCNVSCTDTGLSQGSCPDGAFCLNGKCEGIGLCSQATTGLPSHWDDDNKRCSVSCSNQIFGTTCGSFDLFCDNGQCRPSTECPGKWEESTKTCLERCDGHWGTHSRCHDGLFCMNKSCHGEADCRAVGGRWDPNKFTCKVSCKETDFSNVSCPEGTFCSTGECIDRFLCWGDDGVWNPDSGKCIKSCSDGFGEHSICPDNYFCDGKKCLHKDFCLRQGLVWDGDAGECFRGCYSPFGEQSSCPDNYFCDNGRCSHYSNCDGNSRVWDESSNMCLVHCDSLWGQKGNCPKEMFCNDGVCDYKTLCDEPGVSWDASSETCVSDCGAECQQGTCGPWKVCHAGACVSPTRKICPDFRSSCGLIEEQSSCKEGEWCSEFGCLPECGGHNIQGSCRANYFCEFGVECVSGCGVNGTQGICGGSGICNGRICDKTCRINLPRGGCKDPKQFCVNGTCVDSKCGVVGALNPSNPTQYCNGNTWVSVGNKNCSWPQAIGANGCYRPDMVGQMCNGPGTWYSNRGCESLDSCTGHCLVGSSVICYYEGGVAPCKFIDPEDPNTWPDIDNSAYYSR